ncbi:cysteine dioxygenase [Sneathiella limimaris]|uniref:cysteine dioxygenase family protein n=1 Tax=Sneathiella limimaris TaxID=1964213 RepID=UPI00146D037D|nr:cysteine dioxygenase [Sneathiella limimaris]
MSKEQQRREAVQQAVGRIRDQLQGREISKETLSIVEAELIKLANKEDLFSFEDFPPPSDEDPRSSCLYRLSEDEDHGLALYANVADGKVDAPPHDHTTWAVIVGLKGQEENRFYDKAATGVSQKGSAVVEKGKGVCLLADDIHSIHIRKGEPVLNFHMYGLALEQLHNRRYWSEPKQEWKVFPAHVDIRDAR